jgi:hypothetical protein
MANPQVTEILTGAAGALGDPMQEQFTNAVLLPFYSIAFREAWDLAVRWGLPKSERDAFLLLPANQTVVTPSTVGIADIGEPISVWERPATTTLTITGVTDATPMEVTVSGAHGLSNGTLVEIYNVYGPIGINDQWRITSTATTKFTLNGSVAGGAWVSGGTVIIAGDESTNPFKEMSPVDNIPQTTVDQYLRYWQWEHDAYHFKGALSPVELWIEYRSSGGPPQAGLVGWDNSANFLIQRTASLAAVPYDMPGSAQQYSGLALGPSGQADGTGGSLRAWLYQALREKQNRPARARRFRTRRNALGRSLW